MTREAFIKLCGILGLGLPFQLSTMACEKTTVNPSGFSGRVVVVGAGAGGLSAGYLLSQQGIAYDILEASDNHGGRMKTNNDFADFPIPLGAEWLETNPDVLSEIVNDADTQVDMETIRDRPDWKFVNSSWLGFFEEYILPSVRDQISYRTEVQSIDYSGDQIIIQTNQGQYVADKVIVAVPLRMLQKDKPEFIPALPQSKLEVIQQTKIWEGFKAFFEFSSKFYDEEYVFEVNPETDGQKIFYDASMGQRTNRHIVGLFAVGRPARDYINLDGERVKALVLQELDEIYDDKATSSYLAHIYQNWNKEPFIESGYMTDHADWREVKKLGEPVADKIYFAGGAYTDGEDWVSVHAAALSARKAVTELNR